MDPYEKLANAIILAAVKDYRSALKSLNRNPNNTVAQANADTLERFFHSAWYSILTSVDGKMLVQRLREEANL